MMINGAIEDNDINILLKFDDKSNFCVFIVLCYTKSFFIQFYFDATIHDVCE